MDDFIGWIIIGLMSIPFIGLGKFFVKDPILTIIAYFVRKMYKLPDYHEAAGAFSMLGLMASTASLRQVQENSLRILRQIQKHTWAYRPRHIRRIIDLMDHAEWVVNHRERMKQQDREEYARTERKRQRQSQEQKHTPKTSRSATNWRSVLGVSAAEKDIQTIKRAFRKQAQQAHPDRGGSNDEMVRLNIAMQHARQELGFV